ncbi:kinase RLK-Pelle-L-LEC family protein [Tanacetum coccineum]
MLSSSQLGTALEPAEQPTWSCSISRTQLPDSWPISQPTSQFREMVVIYCPFFSHSGSQLVPFVAVEFDTPSNSNWDPVDGPLLDHVGINVNSSVELEKWWSNVSYGNQYFMKIQYVSHWTL